MRNRLSLRRPLTIALGLILGAASTTVLAISNDEVNAGVQFSFSNPGARSLGLGGAFTGLADDATAAFANPAGLTILRTQELAFEVRFTEFDTSFVDSGVVGFSPNQPIDDSGIVRSSSSDSVFQPSYVSWVLPRERFTIALYYQRLADFEASYRTQGLDIQFNNGLDRIFAVDTSINFDVQNFGAAFGYELSDSFSVGASVAYSSFEIDSSTTRTEDPDFANRQRQRGDDNDVVFTLGTLWRISDQWNLGLAYRTGGEFRYRASNETLPTNIAHPNSLEVSTDFDVPDVLSAGISFRPGDAWLVTLDVNRVYYSALTDSTRDIFVASADDVVPAFIRVDDGTEVRLGVEYAFLNMDRPLFLRGGVWRDPDHRLNVPDSLAGDCDGSTFAACLDAAVFGPGDDEMHYSLGIGWAFEKFQIDAAVDFSDLVDTYSVSGVLRF